MDVDADWGPMKLKVQVSTAANTHDVAHLGILSMSRLLSFSNLESPIERISIHNINPYKPI